METEGGSQLLRLQKRGRVMQICVRDHVEVVYGITKNRLEIYFELS